MAESFDSFASKHANDARNRERIRTEAKAEWDILKGFLSQFALDKRDFKGSPFQSALTLLGEEMLVLGSVAAIFEGDGVTGWGAAAEDSCEVLPQAHRCARSLRPRRRLTVGLQNVGTGVSAY